jgi:transcriptional regulator with XRE-family HTH domain
VNAEAATKDAPIGARLRELRQSQGLSLAQVEQQTGISRSFLSHVENGKGDITFLRLKRLVDLYGVSLMELTRRPTAHPRVVRSHETQPISSSSEGVAARLLSPDAKRLMMPVLAVYEPGAQALWEGAVIGEQFYHVVAGSIQFEFDDGELVVLDAGDTIYLDARRPRRFTNVFDGESILLSVTSPPAY